MLRFIMQHIGGIQSEIVKILSALTANPNAPDNDGRTPISYAAATYGHAEIVKILAPLR